MSTWKYNARLARFDQQALIIKHARFAENAHESKGNNDSLMANVNHADAHGVAMAPNNVVILVSSETAMRVKYVTRKFDIRYSNIMAGNVLVVLRIEKNF